MLYLTDANKNATEEKEEEKEKKDALFVPESGRAAAGNLGMQFFVLLITFTNTAVFEND